MESKNQTKRINLMIEELIIIDDFLLNPYEVRNSGLTLNYVESTSKKGWQGYRCLDENELTESVLGYIKKKLVERNKKFELINLVGYFHYTLENTPLDNTIHKDFDKDFAGVIYLTPNAPKNSGTLFFNDMAKEVLSVENQFNRFTFYSANEWHRLSNVFGDSIENGRLTFTVFGKYNEKNIKSLL